MLEIIALHLGLGLQLANPNPNPHPNPNQVSPCSRSLWSDKYELRAQLARDSGNPGNSCIHLTDRQAEGVLARRGAAPSTSGGGGGMSCDESYGFSCARALLHPASLEWLNQGAEKPGLELTLTLPLTLTLTLTR